MRLSRQKLICLCGSAGSLQSIQTILEQLSDTVQDPIIVLIHQQEDRHNRLVPVLKRNSNRELIVPTDGTKIMSGMVYVAPSGYHIQVEPNHTISYAMDEPVHFSRPSIDVLLQTAARVYQKNLVVVMLSGASDDGTGGLPDVEVYKGTILIQSPEETDYKTMLLSAIKVTKNPYILSLDGIVHTLQKLGGATYETT